MKLSNKYEHCLIIFHIIRFIIFLSVAQKQIYTMYDIKTNGCHFMSSNPDNWLFHNFIIKEFFIC